MLKIKYIVPVLALALSAVAALFFAACQPEDLNSDLPKGAIRLVAPGYQSPNGSKLGVDEEGKNVFFAEGDLLWVNGVQCTISVNENGVAYFVRPESVGYPLRIVYPYGIVDEGATNSDNIPITLPAEYTYATVQDGPGAGRQNVPAPLCAKIVGTGEGQKPNSAFFKHITAAITVAIENKTGAPMELEKIVVKSDYFHLHGSNTINVENPAMNGVEDNLNNTGSDALSVSFSPECICRIENNDRAYIQIPILAQYNPVNSNQKAKLTIGVLAKNMLPGVIANKFYFEKTQGTAFNILQGQLAYAPAYFDINMPDDDDNYGLLVDGTYTIGYDNGKPLKVYLAKGNLQYAAGTVNNSTNTNYNTANTLGNPNPTDAGNWSFMSSQHLKIENFTHNQNQITRERSCSNVYGNGFISQFLYGSTGNNYNNIYTCHPIATPFALRQLTGHPQNDLSRTDNTDWGVRIGGKWFTLSSEQWRTLIGRTLVNKGDRTCQDRNATVQNQPGLILYPDKYGKAIVLSDQFNYPFSADASGGVDYAWLPDDNKWIQMENAGVAFLPYAGYINVKTQNFKNGNKIISQESNAMNSGARYWTSTGIYYLSVSTTTVSVAEASSYGTVANGTFTALVRLAYPANF